MSARAAGADGTDYHPAFAHDLGTVLRPASATPPSTPIIGAEVFELAFYNDSAVL